MHFINCFEWGWYINRILNCGEGSIILVFLFEELPDWDLIGFGSLFFSYDLHLGK